MNKPSEHHNGEKRMVRREWGERREKGRSDCPQAAKIKEKLRREKAVVVPISLLSQGSTKGKGRRKRMIEDVVKNASRTIHPFVLTLQGHSSPLLSLLSLSLLLLLLTHHTIS